MLGEALALGSALSWSFSVVLFRRLFGAGLGLSPLSLNVFKNVVAIALMAATLVVSGEPLLTARSNEDWLRLVVSGVLGIGISDLLFFHALRRLGAGRLTVVECAYSPAVVLFGVLLLDEVPTAGFGLGAVLVVAGLAVVTRPGRGASDDAPGDAPVAGALFGLGAMVTVALAIVLAKPAFATGSLAEVALIRLIAGTVAQLLWILPDAGRRETLRVLAPGPLWPRLLPATILGSWVSTFLWVGGFKYTDASVAAVLNQTTTVITLLLARGLLGEPLTARRVTAVALGFGGALCVVLSRA